MFKNKTLLITGGTGSFGNAVLERFLKSDIGEIRIFSRDEKKQDDMRQSIQNAKVKFYLGDVRDAQSIKEAMRGVDYVFHAAALKQVPSCEFYPMQAYLTNVVGTENTLNAAVQCGVRRIVVLSTDKAVYPINAMGLSKAMMEKLMVAKARTVSKETAMICGTRYGNVLASRGSVVPLFVSQIFENKPLTITDPNMTRFLMSLGDAVDLVLHAFENGENGDIFVQKSPASTIADLAQAVLNIFRVEREIRVIGTRHGEKLYETLLTREERAVAQESNHHFCIHSDNRDLNYNAYFSEGTVLQQEYEAYHSHNAQRLSIAEVEAQLLKLPYIQQELSRWEAK